MNTKSIIAVVLALLITIAAAYLQRTTGPSYPKKIRTEIGGKAYKCKLPRSQVVDETGCEVRIPADDGEMTARIFYKRYPTNDSWDTLEMKRVGNELAAFLPPQPVAGKLLYFLEIKSGKEVKRLDGANAAIIRYRGDVPAGVMLPHIILMFLAMLFANLAGLQAAMKINRMRFFTLMTVITMVLGGLIFGPIMQKYAFGDFWTGVPFGWDLTDNKTLIAILFWLLALGLNARKTRPIWIIIAAVVTLVIYSIPHSMFGSELDYTSGMVTQG